MPFPARLDYGCFLRYAMLETPHKRRAALCRARAGRRNRLKGARGWGTLEKEKPPVLGMIERGGSVVIRMLENVRQKTIEPLITATIAAGTLINTDKYDIYARLEHWGYRDEAVCHGQGEYARDDDGDGFHEMHVNTWRDSGHNCVPGSGRIAAFHRTSCLCIWDFLSLFTTSENEERRFCPHSSSCC